MRLQRAAAPLTTRPLPVLFRASKSFKPSKTRPKGLTTRRKFLVGAGLGLGALASWQLFLRKPKLGSIVDRTGRELAQGICKKSFALPWPAGVTLRRGDIYFTPLNAHAALNNVINRDVPANEAYYFWPTADDKNYYLHGKPIGNPTRVILDGQDYFGFQKYHASPLRKPTIIVGDFDFHGPKIVGLTFETHGGISFVSRGGIDETVRKNAMRFEKHDPNSFQRTPFNMAAEFLMEFQDRAVRLYDRNHPLGYYGSKSDLEWMYTHHEAAHQRLADFISPESLLFFSFDPGFQYGRGRSALHQADELLADLMMLDDLLRRPDSWDKEALLNTLAARFSAMLAESVGRETNQQGLFTEAQLLSGLAITLGTQRGSSFQQDEIRNYAGKLAQVAKNHYEAFRRDQLRPLLAQLLVDAKLIPQLEDFERFESERIKAFVDSKNLHPVDAAYEAWTMIYFELLYGHHAITRFQPLFDAQHGAELQRLDTDLIKSVGLQATTTEALVEELHTKFGF